MKDVCIESGVIPEGSVKSAFECKNYNHGVRFHKLMYEACKACMTLMWKGFMIWIQEYRPAEQNLPEELMKDMNTFGSDVSPENLEALLTSGLLAQVNVWFQHYLNKLLSSNGTMSQFCMSYIKCAEILWISYVLHEKVTGICILPQFVQ